MQKADVNGDALYTGVMGWALDPDFGWVLLVVPRTITREDFEKPSATLLACPCLGVVEKMESGWRWLAEWSSSHEGAILSIDGRAKTPGGGKRALVASLVRNDVMHRPGGNLPLLPRVDVAALRAAEADRNAETLGGVWWPDSFDDAPERLLFADDPSEIARLEAEQNTTQSAIVDFYIERTCWATDRRSPLRGHHGTPAERLTALRGWLIEEGCGPDRVAAKPT